MRGGEREPKSRAAPDAASDMLRLRVAFSSTGVLERNVGDVLVLEGVGRGLSMSSILRVTCRVGGGLSISSMLRTGDLMYGEGDRGPTEGARLEACGMDIRLSISFRSCSSADSSDMS